MFNKLFKKCRDNKLKTATIIVFLYPILPLALLAFFTLIFGTGDIISKGLRYSSVSQVIYQFLLFSGGVSGFIGGLMVILNRVNSLSGVLFLHGSISYAFIATLILASTKWTSLWSLHGMYIALSLLVIAVQLVMISKQVIADKGWRKSTEKVITKQQA